MANGHSGGHMTIDHHYSAPLPAHTGVITNLRRQIQTIERGGGTVTACHDVISLGAPEIDAALPWNGLPASGLHEVFGDTAALGFCAVLLARLSQAKSGAPIHSLGHGGRPANARPGRRYRRVA